MELRWTWYSMVADGIPSVAQLVDGDEATGYRLYCDKHWDTGAPDEWIIKKDSQIATFPTKTEAMQYAEATYTLQEANDDTDG